MGSICTVVKLQSARNRFKLQNIIIIIIIIISINALSTRIFNITAQKPKIFLLLFC